jgi:hypoxanthine phosphoribosyltransferase
MTPERAREIFDQAELLLDPEAVRAAVGQVAADITARLADSNPLVLCVMTGGVIFTGQLLPYLSFPLDFDYLHATRYGPNTQGGKLSWRSAPWTPVKGRSILVVDDILDEGVTLAAVRDRLLQLGAKEVLTAVFVDKQKDHPKPIKADFVALSVPNRFVFGFGMDVDGAWRNLPAVYAMKEPV